MQLGFALALCGNLPLGCTIFHHPLITTLAILESGAVLF